MRREAHDHDGRAARPEHRPPRDCPVCGERLLVTGLGCPGCGTELSGAFQPCDFCGLPDDDVALLRVFLASRGNMKDLERHLGVSYPTARARYAEVLGRLGIGTADPVEPVPPATTAEEREQVLADLAAGRLSIDEAEAALRG